MLNYLDDDIETLLKELVKNSRNELSIEVFNIADKYGFDIGDMTEEYLKNNDIILKPCW